MICQIVVISHLSAHTVSGKVHAGKEPVTGANAILLATDSVTLIKSALTDEDGKFVLENIGTGDYILKIIALGYNQYSEKVECKEGEAVNIIIAELMPKSTQLKEVSVRAAKPLIEVKADRLVVNVENSIVNAGASAMDVLARSPGVQVDQNDNIAVKGRQGVLVMIDGKQTVMAGSDLANMLKGMSSESISKIEIITNPGAKYDAAGTGGIINIVTKRSKNAGFNGSMTGTYAQGIFPKYSAGLNLNYRNNKISSYLNYSFSNRYMFNKLSLKRTFLDANDNPDFAYQQDNFFTVPYLNNNANFGIDYAISKKTTIGIAGTVSNNDIDPEVENYALALDGNDNVLYEYKDIGEHDNNMLNYSANLNLRHNINEKGQLISIDADYAKYDHTSLQQFQTIYTNTDGTQFQPDYFTRSEVDGYTQIQSLKTDYTLPLKEKISLEAGAKTSFVISDNEPLFYDKTTGDYVLDTKRSNHFIYRENINAAYTNIKNDWGKLSMQAGLRVENTNVEADQVTLDSLYTITYTQLFPSFAVQYNVNQNHGWGVTLSRRIQRPNYEQLNPFKFYINNTTYKQGYPYLQPATTYSAELSHTFKKRFVTSAGYSRTINNITEVIQPADGEDTVTIQTNKNLSSVDNYNISGAYPFQVTKWWTSMNNFTLSYVRFQGFVANTQLDAASPAFTINSSNSFVMPANFKGEVSLWYQSRQVYGFFDLRSMWMLNLGVQKSFWNDKASLRLNAQDIFWKGLPRATSVYTGYVESFDVKRDTRQVSISLTYRFGNDKIAPARRRQSGAEDEKRRANTGG